MTTPFDEAAYLAAHPDVAAAVAGGAFASGLEHYERHGREEGRGWAPTTREGRILHAIDRAGLGLEIGPSHAPVAPKRDGWRVHVLDHLDAAGLRAKYAGHGVDLSRIEDVDFVWQGERLVELIGRTGAYDWIVASHVIEHVPDPIAFLRDCEALLAPGGRLSLVVPDKRYCFDHLMPATTTGQWLDAHHERRRRPSPGQVFDHLANASKRGEAIAWTAADEAPLAFVHPFDDAHVTWRGSVSDDVYRDVHCWRFTPESFRVLIGDVAALGLLGLGFVAEFGTEGCEFYATLGRDGRVPTREARLEEVIAAARA